MSENRNFNPQILQQQLLALLAEDLKSPLVQIARLSEQLEGRTSRRLSREVQTVSRAALVLVENYSLALRLANFSGEELAQEPVAASAIIAGVVHDLRPLAASYDIDLGLEFSPACLPIITNANVFAAALTSAGISLIEALAASRQSGEKQDADLRLCLDRGAGRIKAGWYWTGPVISREVWRRARELPSSRSPLAPRLTSPASGVFIADMLLGLMGSNLKTGRRRGLSGLSVSFRASSQLALV